MKDRFLDFINKRPVLVLVIMIIIAGMISLGQFLTLEQMFVFTGLASDSYTGDLAGVFHNVRMWQLSEPANYSFYLGAGDVYSSGAVALDPLSWILRPFTIIASEHGVEGIEIYNFYLKFLLSFLGTGIFTFLWLRLLNVNKTSSLTAGILMAFSSSIVVLAPWGLDIYGFYLSFYLFSFEMIFVKNKPWFFAIAATMLASQPYHLYLYSFYLAVYMLFRFLVAKPNFKKIFHTCLWVFLAGLVGILMNLPNLWTTLMVQINAPRMEDVAFSKVADSRLFLTSEMAATTLFRLFGHNIPGNDFGFSAWNNYLEAPAIYCGILTLIIFPQIFLFLSKRKRIIYSVFLLFWFAVMIFPQLRRSILLYAGDYYRYGIDYFFTFTMILIMAQSLSVITAKKKMNFMLLVGTVLVLGLSLWKTATDESFSFMINKPEIMYFAVLTMVVYVFLLCFINYIDRKTLKILFVVLPLIEVSIMCYSAFDGRDSIKYSDVELNMAGYDDGISQVLDTIRKNDTTKFYRVEVTYYPGLTKHAPMNCNRVLGYFTSKSYSPFNQVEYVRFLRSICAVSPYEESDTRWLKGIPQMPFIYSFFSSKYLITKLQDSALVNPAFWDMAKVKKFPKHYLLENDYVMPLGFALDKYMERSDFDSLLSFTLTPEGVDNIIRNINNGNNAEMYDYSMKLQNIVGKKFHSLKEIDKFTSENFPPQLAPTVSSYIYLIACDNIRQMYSLLIGFVNNEDSDIDLSNYKKIDVKDSTDICFMKDLSVQQFLETTKRNQEESLDITKFNHSYIKGNINLKTNKFLVLTIPFDKSWKFSIDGSEPKTVKKCDVGFSGFEMPAGQHTVELSYAPENQSAVVNISIIAAILFYLAFLWFEVLSKLKFFREKFNN